MASTTNKQTQKEKVLANCALWEHICEVNKWCPSCSIEITSTPVILDKYGVCDFYNCASSLIEFSFDGECSGPEVIEPSFHLTDSSDLTGLTTTELQSVRTYAIRNGLIGLSVRADAAIKKSEYCAACNIRKGWNYTCATCGPPPKSRRLAYGI